MPSPQTATLICACTHSPPARRALASHDGSGVVLANDDDLDGVCNADEVEGCQDPAACNYHALATDPLPCEYATWVVTSVLEGPWAQDS